MTFVRESLGRDAICSVLGVERPAWVSRHVLTENWAGQLMNGSVIQSIGSLSRQMKAKVLGLRLDDATSSATMYLRRLATTRVPRSLSNAATEHLLPSLKRGSRTAKTFRKILDESAHRLCFLTSPT